MAEITGRDRVEANFRGEYLDRVPVYMNCTVSEYVCGRLGYTRAEVLTEPDKELEALELSQKQFPSDIIRMPADPMLPDTIAARSELNKHRGMQRHGRMLENKSDLAGIQVRDPRESKTYKPYLEMVDRVKNLFPDHPVVSMSPGAWSNAAGMRGPETFLFDTVDDPDFVHDLMRYTTELAKARGKALIEAGTDMLIFGDPSAGCSFISPKIYREYVKPYHKELVTHLKTTFDIRVGFHICGFTDPIMEDIVTYPLDWFEIDAPASLEKMKGFAQGKMTVRGNVPTDIFSQGTEEDMDAAVRTCIEKAAPGGGYILGPGCAIPWNVKPENVAAFFQAAYQYGDKAFVEKLP